MFSFTLLQTDHKARVGEFFTPHGKVQTPIFMPVGTQATVKALSPQDLESTNAEIILANTYHLYLRPGTEVMESAGGLHSFMGWKKPILTDSGGFQVLSLGALKAQNSRTGSLSRITEDGVEFTSHLDGSRHFFSPEKAIEIQRKIGADIIMAFDECTPDQSSLSYAREAMERTHRWAKSCHTYWNEQERMSSYGKYQALFGIVQGAMHKELRVESAETIGGMGFDAVAVGGETIGFNMEGTERVMEWIEDILPKDKPRYAMGLGRDPEDIIRAVKVGFDMFDCIAPTRMARNGTLYVGELRGSGPKNWSFDSEFKAGRLQIGNARWAHDHSPIMENCDCWTCGHGFSKAYLRHLYHAKELLYYHLASIHNVRFMLRFTEQLRSTLLATKQNV